MNEVRSDRRALFVDSALGVSVSVVVAVAITVDLGGHRAPDVLAYLFAAALGALTLVRRRFPVLALVATAVGLLAYYSANYPAIGVALPVAAALYSAAEAGYFRAATLIASVLVVVSTAFRLGDGENAAYLLGFELASTVGLMVAVIASGVGVRATRLLREEQHRAERQAAADREREAQWRVENERLRIARDLHDVLAHTVAVVTVHADVASEALDDDPAGARAALSAIRFASDQAVRELRGTVDVLRDPAEAGGRAPAGSLDNVDTLAETTTEIGLSVDVRIEGDPMSLPAVIDTTAYRIVQESLTNCLRHSRAHRAEVRVRYETDRLDISISDDGAGIAAPLGSGVGKGIQGMRERAALLGGQVEISCPPEGGFRVDAWLPLEVRG